MHCKFIHIATWHAYVCTTYNCVLQFEGQEFKQEAIALVCAVTIPQDQP